MKQLGILAASIVFASTAFSEFDMYQLGEPQTGALGLYSGVVMGGDPIDNNEVWGAQVVFHSTRYIAFTLDGTFFEDQLPSQSYSDRGVQFMSAGDLNVWRIGVSGRATLPITDYFAVYGAGGVGYYLFNPQGEKIAANPDSVAGGLPVSGADLSVKEDAQLGLHGAVGAQIILNENVELFAEYNYAVVDMSLEYKGTVSTEQEIDVVGGEGAAATTRVIGTTYAGSSTVDQSYNHGMLRIGLNFYF